MCEFAVCVIIFSTRLSEPKLFVTPICGLCQWPVFLLVGKVCGDTTTEFR